MEKPHSFAGKVIHKYGKTSVNDYEQPDKFFAQVTDFYHLLDGIPYKAIEDLEKYELNRDIMINVFRRLVDVFDAANINVTTEIKRQDTDPFDGLEEDIAIKKTIKISGEE